MGLFFKTGTEVATLVDLALPGSNDRTQVEPRPLIVCLARLQLHVAKPYAKASPCSWFWLIGAPFIYLTGKTFTEWLFCVDVKKFQWKMSAATFLYCLVPCKAVLTVHCQLRKLLATTSSLGCVNLFSPAKKWKVVVIRKASHYFTWNYHNNYYFWRFKNLSSPLWITNTGFS